MFELLACVAVAFLVFGLIFYQNYAERHRSQRMMRLIKRRRAQSIEPPVPPSVDPKKSS